MYKVESKSNLNISIKRQWLELERCLFLNFLKEVIAELSAFVATLKKMPKGHSELIFGNSLHDPHQAPLEAVLISTSRGQPEKKVHWDDIQ
jgi:hypothetical protein